MLEGKLTKDTVGAARAEIDRTEGPLDLSKVTEIDSAGVALLALWARRREKAGGRAELLGATAEVRRTLDLFPFVAERAVARAEAVPLFEALANRALLVSSVFIEFLSIWADAAWFFVEGLIRRKGIRWSVVLYEMSSMGSRALGVVGLISFLVGATMALQSAQQLRQFGANIFVVDLIGISMTRELGPLMTAIVVAGRSGSAVAAEIGTMVITEEVDALKTMGLNPVRFLVVPKAVAIAITQPLLTMLADLLGVFGGFIVAVTYLEVGPSAFMNRLEESLLVKDLLTGLIKSVMFSQLVVLVGAAAGFRTTGGADAVGRSTTASVVAGIFAVIAADAIASLVFYF